MPYVIDDYPFDADTLCINRLFRLLLPFPLHLSLMGSISIETELAYPSKGVSRYTFLRIFCPGNEMFLKIEWCHQQPLILGFEGDGYDPSSKA